MNASKDENNNNLDPVSDDTHIFYFFEEMLSKNNCQLQGVYSVATRAKIFIYIYIYYYYYYYNIYYPYLDKKMTHKT